MLKRELRQQEPSIPINQKDLSRREEERRRFIYPNEAGDVPEIRPSIVISLLVGPAPQYSPAQKFTGGFNNQQNFQSADGLSYPKI